ncbi:MAG: glycerol acyltransferase [Bacteroidaceae bacterium]|nr:glycerol acyltransferase [Bacteroidaceae bacterium]
MKLDVESMLEKRYGKGKVPRIMLWYLRRLFHEDFLNRFFEKGYTGTEFCDKAIDYLGIKLQVEGEIPGGGPYTFVSNHPLGGADGLALLSVIGKKGDVMLLGNDFLTNIDGLRPMIVPVNKIGMQSRTLKQGIDNAYSGNTHILDFPAGQVSRRNHGVIADRRWSKTFLTKSIETHRDIIPIHFYGTNSRRFYRMGRIQQILELRFPLGMIFLPDELYLSQGKTYRIVIGRPIPWYSFDRDGDINRQVEQIKNITYSL